MSGLTPPPTRSACTRGAIPIGTIIAGWILWYLLHKKARLICSDDYQNVLAATSEIKWYRRWSRQEHLAAPQHKEALKKAA